MIWSYASIPCSIQKQVNSIFLRNHRSTDNAQLITNAKQVTPRWLTAKLAKSAVLPSGAVRAVHIEEWKTTNLSTLLRLTLDYTPDAPSDAPHYLILKYTLPEIAKDQFAILSKKEYDFYTRIIPVMTDHPVPRCYDAMYRPDHGKLHILMDDLSRTHMQAKHPLPPTREQSESNIVTLASFHAYWWNDARLGKTIGKIYNDVRIQKRAHALSIRLHEFIAELGDRLSQHRRQILLDAMAFYASLMIQQRDGQVTVVHGDAHSWNFLNPIDPQRDMTYLIDWEFWTVDSATNDLAFMIALGWYPDRRAELERDLLRLYHATLVARGVQNYTWDDCWLSYRYSVIKRIFTPLLQWESGLPPRVWWHNLERAFMAYDDLACGELVRG